MRFILGLGRLALIPAFVLGTLGCSTTPQLVLSPQPSPQLSSLPDGLVIRLYRSEAPEAYRVAGGSLVPTSYPLPKSSEPAPPVPAHIRPQHHPESFVVLPESGNYVVLTSTEHWGLWPHELLSMLAGHPVPHNELYLEVFSAEGRPLFDVRCLKGRYLSGVLIWSPGAA